MNSEILAGVDKLLDDYASITPDDTFVIVYTPECRLYAAYLDVGLRLRGLAAFAKVAMHAVHDPELRDVLHQALPSPSEVGRKLIMFVLEIGSLSHVDLFTELFGIYGKSAIKLFRVIDASEEFFTMGLNRSPRELALRNATLLAKLRNESRIRVSTEAGTDVTIDLDQDRYDWISSRGAWLPDSFVILPAGEIATYPARVDGTIVADGGLNTNVVTGIDMRLGANPLTMTIEDSVITGFSCANQDVERLIGACLDQPHGRRVGELGFGTHDGIAGFLPANTHLNERFPGLHLGLGKHNQPGIVSYVAPVHLDVITNGGMLYLPAAGESLNLTAFTPIARIEHPALKRDQDVVGSCCSDGCVSNRLMRLIDMSDLIRAS